MNNTPATYLDDPEMSFELEPTRGRTLAGCLAEMFDRDLYIHEWEIILRGYALARIHNPEASDADCFDTSMVWYFG